MSLARPSLARYAAAFALTVSFAAHIPAQQPVPKPNKKAANAQAKTPQPIGGTYEPNVPELTNNYPLTDDSKPQPGVPKGKEFKFEITNSTIFPDTTNTITVYVPAQYTSSKPAALWVQLDNLSPQQTTVFDNLIARKELPVIIGVGVHPGTVESAKGEEDHRNQRSFEFDALSDRLARFLMTDVLPAVMAQKTPSGDPIRISADPNDHGIGGGSTGGIGAFTVAFQRPDYFRRVFTTIGTFVGMRGGEQEYVQVRKTEPRPIRVFMNDGANDEWPGGPEMGDWHMANLTMNRALEFAGYDVKHVWGQGSHNGAQAAQLWPDAQRWLWRDYPAPIVAKAPGNQRMAELLIPGQDWQASGPLPSTPGPDGKLYSADSDGGFLVAPVQGGKVNISAKDLHIRGLAVRANGDVYATVQAASGDGQLWRITPEGKETKLDDNIRGASGLAFSPDGLWLLVAQSQGQHGLDYRVKADGSVDAREAMYQFAVPLDADDSGAGSLAFDTQGWLYAATRMGVQVFDRNGRVTCILPLQADDPATSLTFGGTDSHTLYVATASGKVYKRQVKVTGYSPSAPPIKLPPPSAG